MPVLTLCLTTVGSFAILFLSAKIIGHKQIAQLDFFDYITGITIGSIAAEMATELEEPWKPLIAMVIYGGITLSLSLISSRFPRSRKYLNGTPTILLDHASRGILISPPSRPPSSSTTASSPFCRSPPSAL